MFRSLLLYVLLALFIVNCSSEMGGGSTDTELGGPVASGIVADSSGMPLDGAIVTLVPDSYNPVKDGSLSSEVTVVTDKNGGFEIVGDSIGIYSIDIYHPENGSRALLQNVMLDDDTLIDTLCLYASGAITVLLPANVDTSSGYLTISGTTLYKSLSNGVVQKVGSDYYALFDSLPATSLEEISYIVSGSVEAPVTLLSGVGLSPTDTLQTVATTESWELISNGLPNDTILCSRVDNAGIIWIGTAQNGLYQSSGSTWKVYDTTKTLGLKGLSNRVTSLLVDHDDRLWIGTDSGLASFKDTVWVTHSVEAGAIPSHRVMDLGFDEAGDLLVLFSNVIYKHTDTMWYSDSVDVSGVITDLKTIAVDNRGAISIGAGSGLYQASGWKKGMWEDVPMNHASDEGKIINEIVIDDNGDLWCATNDGIHLYNEFEWIVFNNGNSEIPLDFVNCISLDNSNMIWAGFGASDAVSRLGLLPKNFNSGNSALLSGVGAISDISVSSNDEIYISTVKGILIRVGYGLAK